MTLVISQIAKPTGEGAPGWVTIRLRGLGLQLNSDLSVLSTASFRAEGGGRWSRDLIPNTSQAPYYSVTQSPDNGAPREVLISVPASDRAFNLSDLITAPPVPTNMDSYVFVGPPGPAGADGAPGVQGPAGPPGTVSGTEFTAAVAAEMDPGDPARVVLDAAFEPLIERAGATAGQLATLQADGSVVFQNAPAGESGTPVPDATTATKGLVELATTSEATTGSDASRAVTPAGLKAAVDASASTLNSSIAGKVTGTGITAIRALSQSQYDALSSRSSTTLYVITG